MRRGLVLVAVAGALAAWPAPAAAQEGDACAAPAFEAFQRSVAFRAGLPAWVSAYAPQAVRTEWTVGDEVVLVAADQGGSRIDRVFRRPGTVRISVVAVAACGARSAPATLTLTVGRACRNATGGPNLAEVCTRELGELDLSAGGLTTDATWLTPPCLDNLTTSVPVAPDRAVARAASCSAPIGPPPVEGRLPAGRRVVLRFGAPVHRVRAALGTPRRPVVRLPAPRRRGRSGRVWVVALPAGPSGHRRLHVTGRRRGGWDRWVAGIRPR